MATQIVIDDRFDCKPTELFALLSDDGFDDDLMKALSMQKELQAKTEKKEGTEYRIRLTSSEAVPAMAKGFIGEHLSYVETRAWNNAGLSNTWVIVPEVKGAKVEAKGTTEIVADGQGCVRPTRVTVSVNLPLIGRKIEEMVLKSITETFSRNADYCRQRLAK